LLSSRVNFDLQSSLKPQTPNNSEASFRAQAASHQLVVEHLQNQEATYGLANLLPEQEECPALLDSELDPLVLRQRQKSDSPQVFAAALAVAWSMALQMRVLGEVVGHLYEEL
jgi:hypothetical protein